MSTLGEDLVASIEEKKDAAGSSPLITMTCCLEQSRTPRGSNVEAPESSCL